MQKIYLVWKQEKKKTVHNEYNCHSKDVIKYLLYSYTVFEFCALWFNIQKHKSYKCLQIFHFWCLNIFIIQIYFIVYGLIIMKVYTHIFLKSYFFTWQDQYGCCWSKVLKFFTPYFKYLICYIHNGLIKVLVSLKNLLVYSLQKIIGKFTWCTYLFLFIQLYLIIYHFIIFMSV